MSTDIIRPMITVGHPQDGDIYLKVLATTTDSVETVDRVACPMCHREFVWPDGREAAVAHFGECRGARGAFRIEAR